MENLINRVVAGRILRQTRKAKGLSLENCAKELGVSSPTLSRIEKGSNQPRLDTIKKYAKFLECNIQHDYHAETEIATALEMQEHRLNLNLERSDNIDIKEDHPYWSYSLFLDAKEAFQQGNYEIAEQKAKEAIEFYREELNDHNIFSAAANLLSLVAYKKNKLEEAIHYVDLGLDRFLPTGERQYLYSMLLCNKVIYLDKMGQILKAGDVVNELMEIVRDIPRVPEKLNAYDSKARYELARRRYEEAIHYAEIGLQLSSENGIKDSFFEFAIILGKAYYKLSEKGKAKESFSMALLIENEIHDKKIVAELYTSLGWIYLEEEKEDAHIYFDNAVKLCMKQKYFGPRYIDALAGLGEYWLRTQRTKAIGILEKAFELAENQGIKSLQGKIAKTLSLCYEGIDSNKFSYYAKSFIINSEEVYS